MCLGLKRLLKYPREHTLSNKRSVNSIEKVERKLPWKWSQVVFRCLGNQVPFSPKIMIACHFGLPYFYYLLFLNEKKIFIQVFWKTNVERNLRSTSFGAVLVFRHAEEWDN